MYTNFYKGTVDPRHVPFPYNAVFTIYLFINYLFISYVMYNAIS